MAGRRAVIICKNTFQAGKKAPDRELLAKICRKYLKQTEKRAAEDGGL